MLKYYDVTDLFTGRLYSILAYNMEDAMIRFLCDEYLPEIVRPYVREQIRMYGLFSVARIGTLQPNHLIYESGGLVREFEFIVKG